MLTTDKKFIRSKKSKQISPHSALKVVLRKWAISSRLLAAVNTF
jgi:hypothetical protein